MAEAIAPGTAQASVPPKQDFVPPAGTRLYECMWLVDANTGREDFTKVVAGLREVIEKGGGAWVNGDRWEERRLAYPIKKKKRGLFVISHFTTAPENVGKIDRNARLSDLVLRHMILQDEDGLATTPPVRAIDEEDFGGPPGGGERRFFGGGRRFDRGDRSDRPERTERPDRAEGAKSEAPRA